MRTLTGLKAIKHILDPIHGPIPITPLELKIISTQILQRLRSITQLSLTSFVFPGATHNRFLHCLGTMQIIDKLLYNLKLEKKLPSNRKIYERIVKIMRLSALLHDCGHLPFSHTFESKYIDVDHEFFGKCVVERSEIKNILEFHGINPETIGSLIIHKPSAKDPNFKEFIELLPLLSSDADADRMDYLLRDAYFTGVPYGHIDINRICNFVTISNSQICFYEKAQDALEDFLFARYQMYKIIYIHKTVICYDLILHKLYSYIEKYSQNVNLPFFLPKVELFENASQDWYNETFSNLKEDDLFNSIRILLKSNFVINIDKENIRNLYSCILKRIPIKNCYRYDNLTEIMDSEYCDKEKICYEKLEKHPNLINHWSFLRHDPSEPLRIASPIDKDVGDEQDFKQIRILKKGSSLKGEINLLQNRPNSIIKSIAKHHRVLICYYHQNKKCQEIIRKLGNEITTSSSK